MTTPDYGSVLEDLKAKRAHLDVLIAGLELVAKDAATVERGGPHRVALYVLPGETQQLALPEAEGDGEHVERPAPGLARNLLLRALDFPLDEWFRTIYRTLHRSTHGGTDGRRRSHSPARRTPPTG